MSTVKVSPEPSTVSESPARVSCSPASLSGDSWPAMTWWVRILVSRALSARMPFRSFAGILANASSVGAKTVSASAVLRV